MDWEMKIQRQVLDHLINAIPDFWIIKLIESMNQLAKLIHIKQDATPSELTDLHRRIDFMVKKTTEDLRMLGTIMFDVSMSSINLVDEMRENVYNLSEGIHLNAYAVDCRRFLKSWDNFLINANIYYEELKNESDPLFEEYREKILGMISDGNIEVNERFEEYFPKYGKPIQVQEKEEGLEESKELLKLPKEIETILILYLLQKYGGFPTKMDTKVGFERFVMALTGIKDLKGKRLFDRAELVWNEKRQNMDKQQVSSIRGNLLTVERYFTDLGHNDIVLAIKKRIDELVEY